LLSPSKKVSPSPSAAATAVAAAAAASINQLINKDFYKTRTEASNCLKYVKRTKTVKLLKSDGKNKEKRKPNINYTVSNRQP